MKTILPSIILAAGVMLPLNPLNAAQSYGGFVPGSKFTFTVKERTSISTKGTKVTKNAPIPSGVPDFAKGESVKFIIGSKGQVTGPDFKITFRKKQGLVVLYSNNPTVSKPRGEAATITKNSAGRPIEATLSFSRLHFSGFIPVTNTVNYVFER
jgi:hypothetical protein